MKFIQALLLLLLFSFVFGQEKKDSLYHFYDFKNESKQYEPDFERKLPNDSAIVKTLDSLKTIGYFTVTLDSLKDKNVYLNKGKMYKKIWVKGDSLFAQKVDWFPVNNLDSLVKTITTKYAAQGYPFSKINIQSEGFRNGEAQVSLHLELFASRTIDGVKVEGYEKLSQGYIRHGLGLKKGKIYNEVELKGIAEKMQFNNFIEEIRSPQTLFNTDSTTIYLYVKKVKSNLFDGILGFGNDQNGDFRFNGNVKIELNNNFNSMEQIRLNWIATADKSTTLDLSVRVPYLFKSAIGTQTDFNLYRKDSVFVNTKLEERLFYQITQNSNIGLNLSYESSNFVLDDYPEIASLYDDFNKSGIGLSYEYMLPTKNRLLEGRTALYLLGKTLKRKGQEKDAATSEIITTDAQQYEVGIKAFRIFTLYPKHLIKAQVEGYGLFSNSDFYSENELYRIGGFGSVRGFNEESITASAYGITSLEYRFMPNDGFYVSAFGDYAFVENKATLINENLLGVGVGISFLTQLGVFNLSYAVGKQSDTNFDFRNSKIHFGILTRF
ncbi:BamA/TamA family outer membrane protein [Moheibacter sediminis]|uniref:Outer membrane protein assembly factor BamA n=1 Tax=Moheibacter sediminis TaxID=1434700 RepID=A0A1W2BWP4_9FLAO|nr:BamA/TamA family outer membrane protein [Moheibacter sediminis]SMC77126.1 Outer membrane protein assembly factor BamA [Moheibacter sediminis]